MRLILLYTMPFLLLGGVGMYFANRTVDTATRRQRWLKFVTYILIVDTVITSIFFDRFYLCALGIAAIGLWEIVSILRPTLHRILQGVALGLYLIIASGFLAFSRHFDRFFLLFLYFQIITFDGFCQVTGQLVGHHKLVPRISPGKTVEGLIGGTLFCLLAAAAMRQWGDVALWPALGLGLLTAGLAFTGDLLASYVKRLCAVKDYSKLLPGQGGFLDRFDSLLMVGLGYMVLAFLRLLP